MLPLITTYLKTLFETAITNATAWSDLEKIKTVFDGDPIAYNEKNLPAIIIEPIDSALEKMNQYYESTWRIKISVVVATKQFYWYGDESIVAVKKFIQNILERKSSTTCSFDDETILGILKKVKCIVIDNCTIANDFYLESVQYSNLSGEGFVWYRADLIVRTFNKQIQRF